ncbi:MAG TPA: molybdopterin molybdenumtransferase MoeA [Deltaproteobacteria bacterium]|nr:molybdopterin molybdenumtransferase MoeA [Deltaproteobacteria bacterium]
MKKDLCTVEEATSKILARVKRLPREIIEVSRACGRVIDEDVCVDRDIPPSMISLRDGYAICSEDFKHDSPIDGLKIIGVITAGDVPSFTVTPGTAAKIATGALLPEGADTVIPYEDVVIGEKKIFLKSTALRGQFILKPGSLAREGNVVAKKGQILTPMSVCSIVDCGKAFLKVVRKPRVGIVVTGNEVVELDSRNNKDHVFCSNRYLLVSLVKNYGGNELPLGICPDDERDIASVLESSHGCDCVIISGGTGKGEHDCVRKAWNLAGIDTVFDGVMMHPARGTACGWKDGVFYFSLPGNPFASGIAFVQFVSVALLNLSGVVITFPPSTRARLSEDLNTKESNVPKYFWGKATWIESGMIVQPLGMDRTNPLTEISLANCVVKVDPGRKSLKKDSPVFIQPVSFGSHLGYVSYLV